MHSVHISNDMSVNGDNIQEQQHDYDEVASDEIMMQQRHHEDLGTADFGSSSEEEEDYISDHHDEEDIHHQQPSSMNIKARGLMVRDEEPIPQWSSPGNATSASRPRSNKSADGSRKSSANTIKVPTPKLKPGLTLEDIKAGLGMSGSRPGSSNTKKPIEIRDRQAPPTDENIYSDPNTVKLLNLCLELLEFTQLLENSRSETAREWTEKSQVVRQFERLYDSVRDREALFRGKVAEQRKKFQIREGKYFNLKKRARQHLREWQADRDRFAEEAQGTNDRIKGAEGELNHITEIISEQKEELLELRNRAKNMPSEKETTDLNLKLRSLQNENAQLLTDRATLKLTLDELAATLQKRLPTPSTPESLTQVFNTVMMMDDLTRLRSPRLEDPKAGARGRIAAEIAQLEKTAEELQETIRLQTEAFQNELEDLRRQRDEFLNYKRALEEMVYSRQISSKDDEPETLT